VLHHVRAVFPDLPEVFDKNDLCRAIGYKPGRSTLLRVLDSLQKEQKVAVNLQSLGGRQTLYRKVRET
jgi:prophage antirepressor-like protein